jgi:hypothetical protein
VNSSREPPLQFGLKGLFGLMAAVSMAAWAIGHHPLLASLFLIALAFAAWIAILTGLSAALIWSAETLWRLFKKH